MYKILVFTGVQIMILGCIFIFCEYQCHKLSNYDLKDTILSIEKRVEDCQTLIIKSGLCLEKDMNNHKNGNMDCLEQLHEALKIINENQIKESSTLTERHEELHGWLKTINNNVIR